LLAQAPRFRIHIGRYRGGAGSFMREGLEFCNVDNLHINYRTDNRRDRVDDCFSEDDDVDSEGSRR
jgi:hypothetical protein